MVALAHVESRGSGFRSLAAGTMISRSEAGFPIRFTF
jgi:hypothetical protein